MERIVAPYGHSGTGLESAQGRLSVERASILPAKTGRDYLRALRRRWWLAFSLAVLVSTLGTVVVLKLPLVYQAQAEIEVVPPQFDAALMVIVETAAHLNRENTEQFVLNKVAQLRGRALIDSVVRDFEPGDPAAASSLATEIYNGLVTKRIPGTSLFLVTLDSQDQDRVAKLLNALLNAFSTKMYDDSMQTIVASKRKANETLAQLGVELATVDKNLSRLLADAPYFGSGGRNVLEEEVVELKSVLMERKLKFDEMVHEQRISEMWPGLRAQQMGLDRGGREGLDELLAARYQLEQQIEYGKRTVRSYKTDPYLRLLATQLNDVVAQIEMIQRARAQSGGPVDLAALNLSRASDEITKLEAELSARQVKLKDAAPQFQAYLGLLKRREQLEDLIAHTSENLVKFQQVSGTLKRPVEISQRPITPLNPVRPNRVLGVALAIFLGLVTGIGLVLGLEACDQAVKEPGQLTACLGLPVLGVLPRMRRHARQCRGGHLWALGQPDSLEADAFRSLRAGLLGIEQDEEPMRILLVTSAKPGEGKSTTALNLAAACARAGERTILIDCDLRRPSLAGVFNTDSDIGLTDVLQGELPWSRALVDCPEVPGLSFLPTGQLGAIPIEILGSREMKQVLREIAAAYDRVILDAPAILGLADGRMLGRLADATLLVVRCGNQEIHPLKHACAFLEQSRARIAGVVFNGLRENLHHWSSDYRSPAGIVETGASPISHRRRLRELAAPGRSVTVT